MLYVIICLFQDAIEKTQSKDGGKILKDHPSKVLLQLWIE
jgi:hypothetical protein